MVREKLKKVPEAAFRVFLRGTYRWPQSSLESSTNLTHYIIHHWEKFSFGDLATSFLSDEQVQRFFDCMALAHKKNQIDARLGKPTIFREKTIWRDKSVTPDRADEAWEHAILGTDTEVRALLKLTKSPGLPLKVYEARLMRKFAKYDPRFQQLKTLINAALEFHLSPEGTQAAREYREAILKGYLDIKGRTSALREFTKTVDSYHIRINQQKDSYLKQKVPNMFS